MTVAYLFPGQGSQHPGMLHALPDHPQVNATLQEASEILGYDVCDLDRADVLESTVSTQVAIYTAGVAVARSLISEGAGPAVVAGLSVGAYAAAVICGALEFSDGLRMVRLRAELMADQFPGGYGLAAIVGLDELQVSQLVAQSTSIEHPVYVANLNAPRQIVIAGSEQGMERTLALARQQGCSRAERLAVKIPSHCPLLEGVAGQLTAAMQGLEPRTPHLRYMTNRRARVTRSLDLIREDVATNIAHAVRWYDATQVMVEMGVTLFFEVNPGHVLSSLAAEAFPEVRSVAIADKTLDYAVKLAQELVADEEA